MLQFSLDLVKSQSRPPFVWRRLLAVPFWTTGTAKGHACCVLAIKKEHGSIPGVYLFHEFTLRALVRRRLSDNRDLAAFPSSIAVEVISSYEVEILGEKAFPEGQVDIVAKQAFPKGTTRKIIVEVKKGTVTIEDLAQLKNYSE
jgi:hypothetical protein